MHVADIAGLEGIIRRHGFTDYKWFDPKDVVVGEWVRLKCQFGCPDYARVASCPPNTLPVEECRRFFLEYTTGLVFHFQKVAPEPPERLAWGNQTNLALSRLERDIFLAGNQKAFLLFLSSCHMCPECAGARSQCKQPGLSRPTPEGMAMDVYTTVRKLGYPIQVLTDRSDQMNKYAFLLVD